MKATVWLLPALLLLVPAGVHSQAPRQQALPANVAADYVGPGPVVPLPAPIAAALERLRAPNLGAHIGLLAAPALEGRGLGRPGLEAAGEYVAASLALAGISPAAGVKDAGAGGAGAHDAYFQAVPIREITNARGQLTVERGTEGSHTRTFSSGVDCVFPEVAPQEIAAPVVFAGYGIREAPLGRDDYRDLDVRGRIVVVLGGVPAGAEWQKGELNARYGAQKGRARYAAKLQAAAALGARAVLGVEGSAFSASLAQNTAAAVPYFLQSESSPGAEPPLVLVTPAVANELLSSSPTADEKPRALSDVRLKISVTGSERAVLGRNVIAAIPGADPKLRDQAVVLGAHFDHLGRSGSVMYPGADDNASGVAALLEIAKAYAASTAKPRRTLVFAFWTGEEEGHLGSDYYARHPVWPLDRTTVYANLDMIAHPWLSDEIEKLVADTRLPGGREFLAKVKPADFIEPGVAEWAPELCPVLEQAARGLGLALHFDRTDGKSGGSDYRAFARRQVPFIRFFGNYFPGYHEPTDTPEGADPAQVLKMARLALATTWLLADR